MTSPESSPKGPAGSVPPGCPDWITPDLLEMTITVWQRFYAVTLTVEDAVEMLMRVGNLMRVLHTNPALLKGT